MLNFYFMIINYEAACSLLRKKIESFSPMNDADWELIRPHLELKTIKKNGTFIREGKKANEVVMVIEGMLRQYYTKDGEEKTTYFFFENHFYYRYHYNPIVHNGYRYAYPGNY